MEYYCNYCGKLNNKHGKSNRYCNRSCWKNHLKGKPTPMAGYPPGNKGKGMKYDIRVCPNCMVKFSSPKKSTLFCSKGCASSYRQKGSRKSLKARINMSLAKTKEKVFTGFKKRFSDRIRLLPEYVSWRKAVFSRDDYTCQDCGVRGCFLEVHHIVSFSDILYSNNIKTLIEAKECISLWDIHNGITYCRKCHIKNDHNIGRRRLI